MPRRPIRGASSAPDAVQPGGDLRHGVEGGFGVEVERLHAPVAALGHEQRPGDAGLGQVRQPAVAQLVQRQPPLAVRNTSAARRYDSRTRPAAKPLAELASGPKHGPQHHIATPAPTSSRLLAGSARSPPSLRRASGSAVQATVALLHLARRSRHNTQRGGEKP